MGRRSGQGWVQHRRHQSHSHPRSSSTTSEDSGTHTCLSAWLRLTQRCSGQIPFIPRGMKAFPSVVINLRVKTARSGAEQVPPATHDQIQPKSEEGKSAALRGWEERHRGLLGPRDEAAISLSKWLFPKDTYSGPPPGAEVRIPGKPSP